MQGEALESQSDGAPEPRFVRTIGFWLGLAVAFGLQLLPPPEGLSLEAWRVASLGLLMAIWWVTEALPTPVTGLLPLIALPLFAGMKPADAASQYANPTLLLFLGGFLLAIAIEKWGLSKRAAFSVVAAAGPRPRLIVAGFMAATAFVSMWISNTATAMMMFPLALSVAAATTRGGLEDKAFAGALVLGVCYAATIGGVATPIGSPTNLIAVSWLEERGINVAFTDWMAVGVPVMLVLLVACWCLLASRLKTDRAEGEAAAAEVRRTLKSLGRISAPEARVALVFLVTAGLWVGQQWLNKLPGLKGLDDMSIAIMAAVALYVIPAGDGKKIALLSWPDAEKVPWGVILLFGGGLALADAANDLGLAKWLGGMMSGLNGMDLAVVLLVLVLLMIALTEFASNVATISMMLPIVGALVVAMGVAPASLVVPAALAASTGFMMPVGTAANAIAYSTGKVSQAQMIRIGFILNIVAAIVLVAVGLYIAPVVLG
jgi:solute carrier family 13 (sodium-dependent dicarboxylate transporter), member 2/3/5